VPCRYCGGGRESCFGSSGNWNLYPSAGRRVQSLSDGAPDPLCRCRVLGWPEAVVRLWLCVAGYSFSVWVSSLVSR
jgi:hypothetical protein